MKTWFITGASRGLGLATARAALEAGDQVVATARHPAKISTSLSDYEDRLLTLSLDVTAPCAAQAAVESAIARFGRVDILVNNAGYGQLGAFEETSKEDIEAQFATNVFGVFNVTRAVLPVMRAQKAGHILTVSSTAGLVGMDGVSIYCATKFAVAGWSEALSLELAQFNIHATVVHPGGFRTDFLEASSIKYGEVEIEDYHATSSQRRQRLDAYNQQQPGDPQKFGHAMVELSRAVTPPARFVVGSDSYNVLQEKLESVQRDAQAWKKLSISTDFQ
ncbi:oxidoreductase [Pseudomonas aeruginosa]|nr:SDR family NAD(P)-dependent oxidoreductase [Pseudomonas aeruginosa]